MPPSRVQELDLQTLSTGFHLTAKDAAAKFGVSGTSLKKAMRMHGISRWPYRKLKSLNEALVSHSEHLNGRAEVQSPGNPLRPVDIGKKCQLHVSQDTMKVVSSQVEQIATQTHATVHSDGSDLHVDKTSTTVPASKPMERGASIRTKKAASAIEVAFHKSSAKIQDILICCCSEDDYDMECMVFLLKITYILVLIF